MANEIKITITEKGTASKYARKMKSAEKATDRFRLKTSGLTRTIGALRNKLLLVTFATAALTAILVKAIRLAGIQEDAEKRLEVALGGVNQSLLDQASALQKLTTFGDEAIIGVQASIAAFIDNEEAIKRATEATLDMAAATGMDLKSAGDLVAKSLGSSTNALSRYGIVVEGAVGSTERLDSLTRNIAAKFSGQAAAASKTMAGSIKQMSNAVGDASEALGRALSPAVINITTRFKEAAEASTTFFDGFAPAKNATEELAKLLRSFKIRAFISGDIEAFNNLTKAQQAQVNILKARIKAEELLASFPSVANQAKAAAAEREKFLAMIKDKIQATATFAKLTSQISNEIATKEFNNIDFIERKELEAANRTRTALIASAKRRITDSKELAARLAVIEADFQGKVTNIQEEADNERAEIRRKLKPFLIAEAIANTAVAVIKALPNIPLSILVGALGVAQVATIAAQQFAQGGFTSGRGAIVGEQGAEFIKPPAGSQVFTNAQSRQMASQPQTINLIINDEIIASAIAPALERGATLGANNIALT